MNETIENIMQGQMIVSLWHANEFVFCELTSVQDKDENYQGRGNTIEEAIVNALNEWKDTSKLEMECYQEEVEWLDELIGGIK
jgi:hypothetical protein